MTHEFEMALMYEELEHLHLGMTGKTIKLYSVNDKTFSLETFLGNYVDLAKEIPISKSLIFFKPLSCKKKKYIISLAKKK